jgi:maltose O-acetyltransferase
VIDARKAADLVAGILRARFVLRGARLGRRVYVEGRLRVVADGDLALGDRCCCFAGMLTSELICHPGASLVFGAGCGINYGVSIEARQSIRIGDRCKIGTMVRIADAFRGEVAPVVIGDDVWIAHGAIVEPGVTIGRGSVVSAGSVVTTSIPPDSLAIGNPARAVRLEVLARTAAR